MYPYTKVSGQTRRQHIKGIVEKILLHRKNPPISLALPNDKLNHYPIDIETQKEAYLAVKAAKEEGLVAKISKVETFLDPSTGKKNKRVYVQVFSKGKRGAKDVPVGEELMLLRNVQDSEESYGVRRNKLVALALEKARLEQAQMLIVGPYGKKEKGQIVGPGAKELEKALEINKLRIERRTIRDNAFSRSTTPLYSYHFIDRTSGKERLDIRPEILKGLPREIKNADLLVAS